RRRGRTRPRRRSIRLARIDNAALRNETTQRAARSRGAVSRRRERRGDGRRALKEAAMTPQEHNKTLGICHLAYGGLHTLLTFAMLLFFFFFFAAVSQTAPKDGGPPPELLLPIGAGFLLFIFLLTLL